MTLSTVLAAYFLLNILLVVAVLSLKTIARVCIWGRRPLSAIFELRLHNLSLIFILVFVSVQPFLPRQQLFKPIVKVWSAPSRSMPLPQASEASSFGYINVPTLHAATFWSASTVATGFSLVLFAALFFAIGRLVRECRWLLNLKRQSFLIRKIGRVAIYANEQLSVPFAFWIPGQCHVILPSTLLDKPKNMQIVIAHELQHHRQADTKYVYLLLGLRHLCFLNPIIYFWAKWLNEIQEFACDETMVDHNYVEPRAYTRCLVEVAQTAIQMERSPVCATGFLFWTNRSTLNRRIEKMLEKSSNQSSDKSSSMGRAWRLACGLVLVSLMAWTTWAATGLVQDRRVTVEQATAMARKAQQGTRFPIVVNDLVLKYLNYYIGTPEGRENMRQSLERMQAYKPMLNQKLQEYGVPHELLAVPIVESRYQNLAPAQNPYRAAGVWQFIASTARIYGLQVNEQSDERLNMVKSTDAAFRYLLSNQLQFQDWQLAILAYNMGEQSVQKAIVATGSRDAWHLVRQGFEGDHDYLPKVMAAVLIYKNPETLD